MMEESKYLSFATFYTQTQNLYVLHNLLEKLK